MITGHELIAVLLVPIVIAASLCLIARATRQRWLFPASIGIAFLAGYALLGVPRLPPRDGTDWLFWLALPITLLGVTDSVLKPRSSWPVGLATVLGVFLIGLPLTPAGISVLSLAFATVALAAASMLLAILLQRASRRVGGMPTILCLCGVAGGAAILVLSSNLRILGIYGLAVATATGPMILSPTGKTGVRVASLATVAIPLIVAVLFGGHLYADPGLNWMQLSILLTALAVFAGIGLLPVGNARLRAGIALVTAAALVAAVVAPAALAAKKAAADDPHATQE